MKKENKLLIVLFISLNILIFTTILTYTTRNIISDTIFIINVVISLYICIELIKDNLKNKYISKIKSE